MTSQNSYYSDPIHRGWRGNIARAVRNHAAAVARDKRHQSRLRRTFEADMQAIIDARRNKK